MVSRRAIVVAAVAAAAIALLPMLSNDDAAPPHDQGIGIVAETGQSMPHYETYVQPGTASKVAEVLARCEPYIDFLGEDETEREQNWQRLRDEAGRVLAESDNPEHLVAVARLEQFNDPDRSLE